MMSTTFAHMAAVVPMHMLSINSRHHINALGNHYSSLRLPVSDSCLRPDFYARVDPKGLNNGDNNSSMSMRPINQRSTTLSTRIARGGVHCTTDRTCICAIAHIHIDACFNVPIVGSHTVHLHLTVLASSTVFRNMRVFAGGASPS